MEIAIMIEGQNGLTWPRWKALVLLIEELGFVGLYRSDHFTNARPPDVDSLELWVSLTWLAANTSRIEFGPLVTPFSFRHPALTARMAAAVDDLSGGRLALGLGAGWQEREHQLFGFDLLDMNGRFARFEEGLECVSLLMHSDGPVTFHGRYYHLEGAHLLPPPQRAGGPPILVGGNGYRRTLQLAAKYASEWNANFIGAEQFDHANQHLTKLLKAQGRAPGSVRRSLMTGCVFARDLAGLQQKLAGRGRTKQELIERGMIVAAGDEIRENLKQYAEAGVQRIMLQWLELDDLDGLRELAKVVL
ncbi:MAG TPA: TIGR03560 family F420-dependent LLM class oxidoreductase [Anaerolineales bacterium]|nr:TIGR03560 family F420-dependent LLM class oxidoreductase [Anaerolineales bacterium]